MNWTEINTEKYYRKTVGHSTSEIRNFNTEIPNSNGWICWQTGEPSRNSYVKTLLSVCTSFSWTAATRDNGREMRYLEEKLKNSNGFYGLVRFCFAVKMRKKETNLGIKISKRESWDAATCKVRKDKPLGRLGPSARTLSVSQPSVWLLQSSSSGLRSRWILGHFQVSRRYERNHGIRFCKRSTEKFSVDKRSKSGKTENPKNHPIQIQSQLNPNEGLNRT